jgi:hypothetical protein
MRYGGQEERKGRKQGTQRREDENGENDFYLIELRLTNANAKI